MDKRGLTQTDWIISLGVFLIYLVWFFIFINPFMPPEKDLQTGIQIIYDGLKQDIYNTIYHIPIFFRENVTNDFEPMILSRYSTVNTSNSVFPEGYFNTDGDKMLFLANTTATNKFIIHWPVESTKTRTGSLYGPMVSGNSITSDEMNVLFENYKPASVRYKGKTRMSNIKILVDGSETENQGEYTDLNLAGKYLNKDEHINYTTYIFGKNPRLYYYFSPVDYFSHNVTITMALSDYTRYYISSSKFGTIDFDSEDCFDFNTNFVDFNDGITGIGLFFQNNAKIDFCNNNTNINLNVQMSVENETWHHVFFHTGDEKTIKNYPIAPVYGMKQGFEWVSIKKIEELANKSTDDLKSEWKYPNKMDFNISFTSRLYKNSIGAEIPQKAKDIYAKELKEYILRTSLDEENITINIRVW